MLYWLDMVFRSFTALNLNPAFMCGPYERVRIHINIFLSAKIKRIDDNHEWLGTYLIV